MFTPLFQVISILALALLILATSACSPLSTPPFNAPVSLQTPQVQKVVAQNYINGRQFCSNYGLTQKELGRWILVPMDYSDSSKGTTEIYAYTKKAFDPALPSYVFIDGGPGQNTHGIRDVMGGSFNEIRYDQRGLGCSAPATFAIYKDPNFYSTANNVRDLEAIRNAFGVEKWSVYGVSYGTVPATQYGSKYPEHTVSIVLEGVVSGWEQIHKWSYKAEKINILLSELSPEDRRAFSELMTENSEDTKIILGLLFNSPFYSDTGIRGLRQMIPFIVSEGKIQRELLAGLQKMAKKTAPNDQESPQRPGTVDENVFLQIFCKELGHRRKGKMSLEYSSERGFYQGTSAGESNARACDEAGVFNESLYRAQDYPVTAPVYYFQGSHDGATLAAGAYEHWTTVPKGKVTFLLAQKGGHNPNLTRLYDTKNLSLLLAQRDLYGKALAARDITSEDVATANTFAKPNQAWRLWLTIPTDPQDFDQELSGIKQVTKLGLVKF